MEEICAKHVASALPVFKREVPLAQATAINGLRAVFGETYPDPVRVVSVGVPTDDLLSDPSNAGHAKFSIEFCGGTHLDNTSDAGSFAFMTEEGIAKGIRRIVAVTGAEAQQAHALAAEFSARVAELEAKEVSELSGTLGAMTQDLSTAAVPYVAKAALRDRLAALTNKVVLAQRAAAAEAKKRAMEVASTAAKEAADSGAAFSVVRMEDGLDGKTLSEAWLKVAKERESFAMALLSRDQEKGKVYVTTGMSADLTSKVDAGTWLKEGLAVLEGKGGGKPGLAQGQGAKGWSEEEMPLLEEAMQRMRVVAQEKLA